MLEAVLFLSLALIALVFLFLAVIGLIPTPGEGAKKLLDLERQSFESRMGWNRHPSRGKE
jgi:hypothetical protein